MNTQVTIDVNGDPRQVLECAYHTLLSMGDSSKLFQMPNYMDPHLLFARVCIDRRYLLKRQFPCLVVVRKIDDISCELSITADETKTSSGKGIIVLFMSEFLQLFSQNFYSSAQPQK